MNKRKETRLEIIEGSERRFVKWDCEIEESIQDDGRTLKLFVKDNEDNSLPVGRGKSL